MKRKFFFNSGKALWSRRKNIYQVKKRLKLLANSIGRLSDSSLAQYAQLYSITLEFKPSLIIEVGRGWGNSTAVLVEAANKLTNTRKVVSLCLANDWQERIRAKIEQVVEKDWFSKLEARIEDYTKLDIKTLVKQNDSVLFFLDAHGWDVIEHFLSNTLPILQKHKHLILVHDVLDVRYHNHLRKYTKNIWRGYNEEQKELSDLIINNMASPFEEIISIHDFSQRNYLEIHSVEHEIRQNIHNKQKKIEELSTNLGTEMSSPVSSFIWFSLNEAKTDKIFFPKTSLLVRKNKPIECLRSLSDSPSVSIITPCFNSAKYISECIESVLGQDYPCVEHVIQDGNSTDGTLEIIKKYSKQFKNIIKWQSEKDNGQSDGLNKALKRAKGEIILVLNADDALMPYACSWAVVNMKLYPEAAVVYGDEYIINEKSQIIHFFTGPEPYNFAKIFCVEQVIPAQAAFIRRKALEEVGLYADISLETCPDYEMWIRLSLKYPMKHVYGPIAKYRWHKESEGQKEDMIDRMIIAKKSVMNRVFENKNTPQSILKLKKRAYAGVYGWASEVSATIGARQKVFCYLAKSIYYYPKVGRIIRFGFITIKYTRILLNKIINNLFQ